MNTEFQRAVVAGIIIADGFILICGVLLFWVSLTLEDIYEEMKRGREEINITGIAKEAEKAG